MAVKKQKKPYNKGRKGLFGGHILHQIDRKLEHFDSRVINAN